MYNSDNPATDNIVPFNSKSIQSDNPKTKINQQKVQTSQQKVRSDQRNRQKEASKCKFLVMKTALNKFFKRVTPKDLFVYIQNGAKQTGYCFARNRRMAIDLETTEETIKYLIRVLLIMGAIEKHVGWNDSGYRFRKLYPLVHVDDVTDEVFLYDKDGNAVKIDEQDEKHFDENEQASNCNNLTKKYTEEESKKILPTGGEIKLEGLKIHPKGLKIKPKSLKIYPYTESTGNQKEIKRQNTDTENDVSLLANIDQAKINVIGLNEDGSVSDSVSCFSLNRSVSVALQNLGIHESQAESYIERHGANAVAKVIQAVAQRKNVRNMGAYLSGILRKDAINIDSLNLAKKVTATTSVAGREKEKEAGKELAQNGKELAKKHWENIDNFWKKNYKAFELYQNTRLDEHKGIIFETLEILNSNPRAYPNYPLYEDLNGQSITASNLRIICDRLIGENPNQLMEEGTTSQEPSKNIVPHQVEKANKPTKKPSAGILADIIKRTSGADNFMAKVLAAKKQTNVNKVEKNRMVNEAFIEAVNKSSPTKNGSLFKNEPVSEPVGGQLSQGFSLKTDFKNEPVQNENEPVKLTSPKDDQILHTLSDRQKKIIAYISKANKPSTQDISNQFTGVSKSSIKRDIKKLIELGKIRTEGENKFIYYCLND